MDSLPRARAKIALCAFVGGAGIAFLAYTSFGLIVLAVALVVAAAAALWLWRARPDLFTVPPAGSATPSRSDERADLTSSVTRTYREPEPARRR
jgi:hypothetical protein